MKHKKHDYSTSNSAPNEAESLNAFKSFNEIITEHLRLLMIKRNITEQKLFCFLDN